MTPRAPWRALAAHLRTAWLTFCWVLAASTAWAQPQADAAGAPGSRLRIVGGLGALNQYTRHEEPFWTRELARLSGGRHSAEIVPFDRAGIRGQEMLSLIRLGVVPFGTALLSVSAATDAALGAADLPGLNPDMAALKRTTAAFRPHLEAALRQRYGIEVLAVYTYPAQVTFCKRPLSGLDGLAGRRVRTSGPAQSQWVEALGGTPVPTGFAEMLPNLRAGNIDCAITGTMSGNTVGLHELTSHLHSMPVTWGLAVFAVNASAWAQLPDDLKALLQRELPRLEKAIWAESERETGEGIACNVGAAGCTSGRKGSMVEVRSSAADDARRRALFATVVLPGWLQRCGAPCAALWNESIGPITGFKAKPP